MAWLEISIDTRPEEIQTVAAALTGEGFSDLVISDQRELETFLEENRDCWDYIDESLQKKLEGLSRIQLYLEEENRADMERLKGFVNRLNGRYGPLSMAVRPLEETDWSESWKENYPPQEVGGGLVVLPCWLAGEYRSDRRPVILDPGLTFGTGAHPSTQMVMEQLERELRPGASCLDLGSGSGILSITALRLGAARAVGVDIDPKAEDAARENAALNGFSAPVFTARTGDVLRDRALMERLKGEAYDLVLVNIVADVIIRLAPVLPELLGRESLLICSGILDVRLEDVTAALEAAGLEIVRVQAKEEWRCVCAKRRQI